MIKTVFYDEQYNEVDPEDAQLIIQLFVDENDIVKKRIEWTPKKKSGYFRTISQINKNVNEQFLSQSIVSHYLEIITATQKIVDNLWAYHAQVNGPTEKANILNILSRSYERLCNTLGHLNYELNKSKRGDRF